MTGRRLGQPHKLYFDVPSSQNKFNKKVYNGGGEESMQRTRCKEHHVRGNKKEGNTKDREQEGGRRGFRASHVQGEQKTNSREMQGKKREGNKTGEQGSRGPKFDALPIATLRVNFRNVLPFVGRSVSVSVRSSVNSLFTRWSCLCRKSTICEYFSFNSSVSVTRFAR